MKTHNEKIVFSDCKALLSPSRISEKICHEDKKNISRIYLEIVNHVGDLDHHNDVTQ